MPIMRRIHRHRNAKIVPYSTTPSVYIATVSTRQLAQQNAASASPRQAR